MQRVLKLKQRLMCMSIGRLVGQIRREYRDEQEKEGTEVGEKE
jgi:hypothetical protein